MSVVSHSYEYLFRDANSRYVLATCTFYTFVKSVHFSILVAESDAKVHA